MWLLLGTHDDPHDHAQISGCHDVDGRAITQIRV